MRTILIQILRLRRLGYPFVHACVDAVSFIATSASICSHVQFYHHTLQQIMSLGMAQEETAFEFQGINSAFHRDETPFKF